MFVVCAVCMGNIIREAARDQWSTLLDDGKEFLTSHRKVYAKVVGYGMASLLQFSLEKAIEAPHLMQGIATNLEEIGYKRHATTATSSCLRLGLQVNHVSHSGLDACHNIPLLHVL